MSLRAAFSQCGTGQAITKQRWNCKRAWRGGVSRLPLKQHLAVVQVIDAGCVFTAGEAARHYGCLLQTLISVLIFS
jgi:hypothetical protein